MQTVRSLWPTLVAIAFVHLVSPRLVSIPEPALIFTVPVAFAAVRGGRLLGLLAASIALADVAFSLYASGDHVARFDQDAMVRLAVTAFCLPALVLLLGRFRDRMREGDDLRAEEREIAHKDGRRRIHSISTSQVETEGNLPSVVAQFQDVTSRKQTEEALRSSELRFRQMAETIGEVFWIASADGKTIHYINPAFEKIWGRPSAQLYANPDLWLEAIHPEDLANVRSALESLYQGGTYDVDYRITRPDGTVAWISDRGYVQRDDHGQVIMKSGVASDITWRKQAEQALRDREAQYRAVIETTPDGFYVTDHDGQFLEVNDAYLRFSGYTLEELRSMRITDVEVKETAEETTLHMARVRQSGSDIFESLHRTRDGRVWPVEVNVSYWPGGGGRHFTFLRDITQRNAVQSALRRWADSFENCAHGIALGDPATGRVLASNPAYARLQGRSTEEVAGAEILALYEPSDRALVIAKMAEADRFGQVRYEARMIRKDGSLFPIQMDLVSVRDEGGQLLYRVGTVQDISERKRAEQELLDSELRVRSLGDNLPDSVVYQYTRDPDGSPRFVYMSAGVEHITGVKAEDALRDASLLFQLISPESLPQLMEAEAASARELSVFDIELPIRRTDGEPRWMRLRSQPRRLPVGEILWDGVLIDITELKKVEEEVKSLNASLERRVAERTAEVDSMLANATVGLAFADRELRCIRINQYLADIDGLPIEEHLGRTLHDLVPQIAESIESDLQEVFATGRPVSGREIALERPARPSEDRYLVLGHYPVFSADGSVLSVGTSVTDITDRKRSEEALAGLNRALKAEIAERARVETQMRRLATVVEATPDFVGIADAAKQILYLNRAFCEALGRWPDREPLSITDCQPESSLQAVLGEGLPTAERGNVWRGETEFRFQDGRLIPVSQLILAHRDAEGSLEFYATIMRDISERKQLEETLRRHSQQLSEANHELARASRLKDEFLANMSHELRTPLNGILGISESLHEEVYGPSNPRQHRAILDVEDCGRHLLDLINDILDVAKIEAGKVELELGAHEVEQVCQASHRLIKEAALKKRISVSLAIDRSLGELVADQRRLKQVLVNLLSNAVKFTPQGGKIGLDVVGDRVKREVRFAVWDTGIGISPADQTRLFQPFLQLDSGLSRHYEGTGLGLVLVKRLTEMHGGALHIESEVGKGSRFTVVLPWIENDSRSDEAEDSSQPVAVSVSCSAPHEPGATPLILIVDDNTFSVRGLKDYLVFKGYCVELAADGETAIDRAEGLHPDLIFMDIQMPGMDGLEAIRRIRLVPGLSAIPIVALTALAMPGDRDRTLEAGATEYVSKPASLDQLHRLIRSLLRTPDQVKSK
ncbi:MAG: PAS domain S-box protein [Isosphaeraceae bacterium]